MAPLARIGIALALILLVSLAATRTVRGEVPTAVDFAACNEQAPAAVKTGTAWPTLNDRVRAESVRAGASPTIIIDVTGRVIESSDPQVHGMRAEGARDAAYQAAYRACMRRKGF